MGTRRAREDDFTKWFLPILGRLRRPGRDKKESNSRGRLRYASWLALSRRKRRTPRDIWFKLREHQERHGRTSLTLP